MTIKEYLKNHRLITDGAMGTYFSMLEDGGEMISEYATLTAPEKIKKIHKEYLRAGAMLIRTNTFAANTKTLSISFEELKKMLHQAVEIAKEAVEEYEKESNHLICRPFIAGDIGPILQEADKDAEEIFSEYCMIAEELIKAGVNVLLFETFHEENYILRVSAYIKEKYPDFFIMAQVSVGISGFLRSGRGASKVLENLAACDDIDACGFNCSIGSGHMLAMLKKLRLPEHKYLMISPNAGYPEQLYSRMVFMDNAEYFAKNMKEIAGLSVSIIGACCGSTPAYIKALAEAVKGFSGIRHNVQIKVAEKPRAEDADSSNAFLKLLQSGKKVVAVELDPPYDVNDTKIIQAAEYLKTCDVDMITLADSPMGRSRIDSILMAAKLHRVTGMPVMPHVCCRDKNMISMHSVLLGAYVSDIRNLLLVMGDPVPADIRQDTKGVFDYNSIQLMQHVKEMNEELFKKEPFVYGGALNYGLANGDKIIERMKKKMAAGASYFLTQPVFSDADIERIAFLKQKTDALILCGIMPLISYRNAYFIKNEVAGIRLPDEIMNRYREDMNREEGETTGAVIAGEIIKKLSPVADGYYFMLPFNRVSLMGKISIQ